MDKKIFLFLILFSAVFSQVFAAEKVKLRARHLVVKEENDLSKVTSFINSGYDFSIAAEKFSIDPSSRFGGDTGIITKGDLMRELEEAILNLKIGEISKAVKTKLGTHLIQRLNETAKIEDFNFFVFSKSDEEDAKKIIEGLKKNSSPAEIINTFYKNDYLKPALITKASSEDLDRNILLALLSLNPGEHSGIIKNSTGFHLIKRMK